VAVPLQHQRAVLRIRDPVVLHLLGKQVVIINPDTVKVDGALAAADRDVRGHHLRKVIIRRVLNHTGHDTVDITVYASES